MIRLQAGGVDGVFLGVFVDAEVEQRWPVLLNLLCCSLAALTGLFGGFVAAAVAALTDFSLCFVEAEVEQL